MLIKGVLAEVELNKWRLELMTYQKLSVYTEIVNTIKPSPWWVLAKRNTKLVKKCKLIMKLIVGEGNLRMNTGRWEQDIRIRRIERTCLTCNDGVETLDHMLMECVELKDARENLMGTLESHGIKDMDTKQKVSLIFNKDNVLNDIEMQEIVFIIHEMYVNRIVAERE